MRLLPHVQQAAIACSAGVSSPVLVDRGKRALSVGSRVLTVRT
jgi:hypothetical protein